MQQIELGMKRMPQEELYDDFLSSDLSGEPAQSRFIVIGGDTDCQLGAKFFGESIFRRTAV